jgi:hypothetical protein
MEDADIFFGHLGNLISICYSLWSYGTFFSRFGMFAPRKIWQPCFPSRDEKRTNLKREPR